MAPFKPTEKHKNTIANVLLHPEKAKPIRPMAGPKKPMELQSLRTFTADIFLDSISQSAIQPTGMENIPIKK